MHEAEAIGLFSRLRRVTALSAQISPHADLTQTLARAIEILVPGNCIATTYCVDTK